MTKLFIVIFLALFLKLNLSFGSIGDNVLPLIVNLKVKSIGQEGVLLHKKKSFPGEIVTIGIPIDLQKTDKCMEIFGQENIEHKSYSEIFIKGAINCDDSPTFSEEPFIISVKITYFRGKTDGYFPDKVNKLIRINDKLYDIIFDVKNEKIKVNEKDIKLKASLPFDEVPKTLEPLPYLKEIRRITVNY